MKFNIKRSASNWSLLHENCFFDFGTIPLEKYSLGCSQLYLLLACLCFQSHVAFAASAKIPQIGVSRVHKPFPLKQVFFFSSSKTFPLEIKEAQELSDKQLNYSLNFLKFNSIKITLNSIRFLIESSLNLIFKLI